jgi:putative sterol carrier protein
MFAHAAGAGCSSIVYSSSIAAYGLAADHPEPLVEDAPRQPTPAVPYADDKYAVEAGLDQFEEKHPSVRVVRLRPGILVGRRMEHGLGALMRRRILPAFGEQPLPVVWDEDVADAVVLALLGEARGAFNLVAEPSLPARELASAAGFRSAEIAELPLRGLGRLAPLFRRRGLDVEALREARSVRFVVSSERARHELGWKPVCPSAVEVLRRFDREVPRRLDPRLRVFMRMAGAAARYHDPEAERRARGINLVVHLNLSGPNGGDFTLSVKEAKAKVTGGVPRPPTAVISMRADTFLELLGGRLDVATARFAGRLKITGDPYAGFLIGALVTGFRRATEGTGTRGFVSRRLARWFEGSSPSPHPPPTSSEDPP